MFDMYPLYWTTSKGGIFMRYSYDFLQLGSLSYKFQKIFYLINIVFICFLVIFCDKKIKKIIFFLARYLANQGTLCYYVFVSTR